MDQEKFNALAKAHGGQVGISIVGDGMIDDPDTAGKTKIPNPNPIWKHVFGDGSSMTMDSTFNIVSPLTAVPAPDKGAPAPTVRTKADGSTEQWDSTKGDWVPKDAAPAVAPKGPTVVNTSPSEEFIVREKPDGTLITNEKNPNYKVPGQAAVSPDAKARLDWDREVAAAAEQVRTGEINEARRKEILSERWKAIDAEANQSRIAIESRNTDISQQNADTSRQNTGISQQNANTSAYGQRLGYAEGMAGQVNNAWNNALPFMAPVGTQAAFNANIGQIGSNNPQMQGLPSAPFPYDPNSMPHQAAAQALASISPAAAAAIGASGQQTSFAAPGPGQAVPPESLVK